MVVASLRPAAAVCRARQPLELVGGPKHRQVRACGEGQARLRQRLGTWLDQTGTGLLLVSHRPAMASLAQQAITLG